ncbi:MAG: hypothetical protein KGL37_08750 [Acidobacteriota bacterium]|nr:hypothetical protein [Acidobacteriota bacterium]
MQVIFQQLGSLFIAAIPTAVLFIAVVLAYQFLVQGPLSATLKKRHALTEGAVQDAQKAIAAAEARAAEYAEKLRHARAEVFRAREQRIQQLQAQRESTLEAARTAAGHKVRQAAAELETEAAAARQTLHAAAGELANQVVRAVLPLAAGGSH